MILEEKKITLKDGTEAILKTPGIEDAETMLENIRICSGETDFLSMYPEDWSKATVESEEEWIKHHRENDNALLIACFIDGKAAGSSDISFMSGIKTSHRAVLGITVQKKYWNIGIGSAMFCELMKAAEENEKTEIVELEFVEGNDRAKALYEKFGLKVVSVSPKKFKLKDGTYQNVGYMQKEIREPKIKKRGD
ncbi:MAG: GNAT family N-acetyltransferase [Clostridia bacterium]|nr:GNAT family N-acetyltransferase [Clostridia bacterium]